VAPVRTTALFPVVIIMFNNVNNTSAGDEYHEEGEAQYAT
jgi:hypothetical protein